MKRPRHYTSPPPDDAESITGKGIIDLYPTDSRSQGAAIQPVRFTHPLPDNAESITGHGILLTPADDQAPAALWYDFRWSVPAEAHGRHQEIRTLTLEKPECQAHGATILDLWSGGGWRSADEFVAAVAAATGLDSKRAAKEARKVLREYFLLCADLLP